jgi:hypothetical protein
MMVRRSGRKPEERTGALGSRRKSEQAALGVRNAQMINFDHELDEIVQVAGTGLVPLRTALLQLRERVTPSACSTGTQVRNQRSLMLHKSRHS